MPVRTLIAAAFLSLGTGFVLAFPAGVMMSDTDGPAHGQGVVVLYSFEDGYAGVKSVPRGAGFKRDYGAFSRGDSNGTVGI